MAIESEDSDDATALLAGGADAPTRLRARAIAALCLTFGLGTAALLAQPAGAARNAAPVAGVVGFSSLRQPKGDHAQVQETLSTKNLTKAVPPPLTAIAEFMKEEHEHYQATRDVTFLSCPYQPGPPPPGAPQPSPGCFKAAQEPVRCNKLTRYSIKFRDPGLDKEVTRTFLISIPESAKSAQAANPAPLAFWFHGQYGSAKDEAHGWATAAGLPKCAADNGLITVYPDGTSFQEDAEVTGNVSKLQGGYLSTDMGTGWNVGTGGDEETCVTDADRVGSLKGVGPTEYSCYPSCLKLGKCGKCNWSTCLDDVAFVKAILQHVANDYCIDLSRLYLGGQSNGGMLTHYISQELPDTFAAFNPIYGLPLLGFDTGGDAQLVRHRDGLRETAILEWHDRGDKTIPYRGGLAPADTWTWYYPSLTHMMSLWAGINECAREPTDITDKVKQVCPLSSNVRCYEHVECGTQRRVIYCLYDGHHGTVPRKQAFGCSTAWFFGQFRRTTPVKLPTL